MKRAEETLKRTKDQDRWINAAIESRDFKSYQIAIMHDWLRTLTLLAAVLIPLFFVLDVFMMPAALLPKFAVYRASATLIALIQMVVVLQTKPSRWSYLHGYIFSLQVGLMVTLMTIDLGGFTSSYYAGLNLVIIAVNLLMPWHEIHTFFNALLVILMYTLFNMAVKSSFPVSVLINNFYFLGATAVLSIGINFVRFRLIQKEFNLLIDLKKTGEDLLSEKEKVEDRTRSLKSLLDVSGQGFLSFDSSFTISSEYSRECIKIFGKNIEGLRIDELICGDSDSRTEFRMGLELYFNGKAKPEVIFEHLDSRVQLKDKTVRTAYKAVHKNLVMLVLTDITEELRLQEESRIENEKWDMLRKVITNRLAFGSFDKEAKILFADLVNQSRGFELLLQDVHTLKGNAGFLGFKKTFTAAHELEEILANRVALGEEVQIKKNVENLMSAFADEMLVVTNTLGSVWRLDAEMIEIPKTEYLHIEDYVKNYCPNPALISEIEEHRKKPLSVLLARFPSMAEEIARRLGKRITQPKIIGGEITVIPEDFEELIESFTHIIRNTADHGIEMPSEREAKGKPAAGTIGIEIEEKHNEIFFHFSDDGRGIQFDEIEERAKSLGYLDGKEETAKNKLLPFIFRDNFSTAPGAGDISGRGVGLAAVRTAVKKTGGVIRVQTWKDRGTIFTIQVPIKRT